MIGLKRIQSSGSRWRSAFRRNSIVFGHLKDEAQIKECERFEDLVKEIDDYIDYHNNFRGQWNLRKMTPVQYRNHLLN